MRWLVLPLLLLLAGCVTSERTLTPEQYAAERVDWNDEQKAAYLASVPKGQRVVIRETSIDWAGLGTVAGLVLSGLGYGVVKLQQRTEERTVARVNAERGPAKPMELTEEEVARLQRMAKEAT